ncbi:M20 family metallopeptidase [Bacillus swezeyi]|uniref:M20 family metallopeptidase n=1 Tax=Bacillus swezeyi TaxID=1925020 RepID=UPI00123AA357|nr:M20 family metallopeptidase [Bacillus swezeyi]KAA6474770.1 amidohydrolase [Bacillus swezeyi]
MNSLIEELDERYPEMVELRRHFHQYPELSHQEVNTPLAIAKYLENLGVEVRTNVGGQGVVGLIKGGLPGKTVALRADFDALPIQDQKDVPYRSTVPGVMHACGHDAHTSALLLAAKVLARHKKELKGNVVLIHQFGEEVTPGGAKPMIEDGCLDGADAIFGTHIWAPMPVGQAGVKSGAMMAAADKFTITVSGRGGHGGAPHLTTDALVTAASVVNHLQQIVSRRIDPTDAAVISIGTFHSGQAFNIIAEEAVIEGTVRTFSKQVQETIITEMKRIIKGVCDSNGASFKLDYEKGYPPVFNHEKETDIVRKCAKNVLGEQSVIELEPNMIGEDFSYYLEKVPGSFFFTGAGNQEAVAVYPHHHPKFDIDEKGMLNAAKILVSAALEFLNQH